VIWSSANRPTSRFDLGSTYMQQLSDFFWINSSPYPGVRPLWFLGGVAIGERDCMILCCIILALEDSGEERHSAREEK
jgi:hypothetical protein